MSGTFMPLETMGNYSINLVPFWKMEEADWVVLRLLFNGSYVGFGSFERQKAEDYLVKKYGKELVLTCVEDLKKEYK